MQFVYEKPVEHIVDVAIEANFFMNALKSQLFACRSIFFLRCVCSVLPSWNSNFNIKKNIYIVPVPYLDTLRKMHFFHPCMHVIGLQKGMIIIPGLLTEFKKISNLVNALV